MVNTVKVPVMDTLMPLEKLKPLLASARKQPISVALSITMGDEEPIILPHRTAGPKKAMTQLKAEAAKAKVTLNAAMTRFGVAHVDESDDPAVLKIDINKEAPDKLELKMTQLVKRFSYKSVKFIIDSNLENEQDDQDGPAQQAPKQADQPADPKALSADLQALMKRLPAAGARLPDAQALARRADTAIKLRDPSGAAKALDLLRALLDEPAAIPADAAQLQSYDKVRRVWLETVKSADSAFLALTAAIKAAYDPEGLGDVVAAAFTARARPVMDRFDAGLAVAIQAVIDAGAGARPETLKQARKRVADLQAELAATPMLALLDASPLRPAGIAKPITTALVAVARILG